MDLLAELGRTFGFSFAAGINLYATVALLGLASRFGWVALPSQYQAFDQNWVIYTALALYIVEFLADKIPWVDSVWDAIHSFIRPVGGAAIAVIALAPDSPTLMAASALLGGLVAGSTHVTKAGTRVIVNASPEPFSNWALSLGEDTLVVALGLLALKYPLAALGVTAGLLVVILMFAAVIIRAFRRRFGRGRSSGTGRPTAAGAVTAVLIAIAMAVASAQQPPPPAQAQVPPAQQPPAAQGQPPQPPPVFRAGANFVRVDAYATKDGVAVTDLKAEDFEILEDGKPQIIETFEHVQVDTGGAAATRVEPRTIQEARAMASDPRARVFVIYLDTWHMRMGSGYNVLKPLVNLLNRVIGPDDLVAIMKPQMSARDIMFTRRTDHLANMLMREMPLNIGQRDRLIKDDPVEQQYEYCYPPDGTTPGRVTSPIAQAMIDRRREKQSIDGLWDLVVHLNGLREERKAILVVSEGWLLYRESRALAEVARPQISPLGIGPTGRMGTADRNNPYVASQAQCDVDRINLANLDNNRRFLDLLDLANAANATFYPVDPAGLRVFDSDIGPNPPLPIDVDMAMLKTRLDSLVVAAINTDGVAVINSNDLDGGLKKVVADLTSYYLMGYTSTNPKLDGSFRSIKVRSKRPGVDVRARRGYRAPTEKEVAMRAAGAPPPVVDEATAAVNRAITSLSGIRTNAPFRLQVSPGWWTPPGPPAAGKPPGAEPALWIYGEVDTKRPGADDWSKGGDAEIAILSGKGDVVTSYTVPLSAGGTFTSRFPRSDEDVWLDPGAYSVRVRAKPTAGGLPTQDTIRFELPKAVEATTFVLGEPIYARRSQATGNAVVTTADLRFRRTERLLVDASCTLAPETVTAELLDRTGKVLPVPATASVDTRDGVIWVRGDLTLSSLAPAEYVLRITAGRGTERRVTLAPFKVVP